MLFVCGFCSKRYGPTKAELRSNEKMRGEGKGEGVGGGGRKKADFFLSTSFPSRSPRVFSFDLGTRAAVSQFTEIKV